MRIEPYIDAGIVLVNPVVADRDELLDLIAARASKALGGVDSTLIATRLREREAEMSTATPDGVALPHAIDPVIPRTRMGVVLLDPPLPFVTTMPPVKLAFPLFGPSANPCQHVRLIARIARLVTTGDCLRELGRCRSAAQVVSAMLAADRALPIQSA